MSQNTKIAGYNAEATPLTGVNPVHKIQFGVCITGRKNSDTPETVETKIVKDAESLSISVDGTIEEWNPMDQAGWVRRLMTGKSLGMSFGGKRNYGDEGNDYVASRFMTISNIPLSSVSTSIGADTNISVKRIFVSLMFTCFISLSLS